MKKGNSEFKNKLKLTYEMFKSLQLMCMYTRL